MKVERKPGPGAETLKVLIAGLSNMTAKVGWFESAKYEDGTNVAYVATIHEYGAPAQGIPARPFMRPTAEAKQENWKQTARQGAQAVADGGKTSMDVMEALGALAAGDVRRTISQLTSPPLAPSTIAGRLRKRADKKTVGLLTKPLVDTGTMITTLSHLVEDK